MNDWRPFVYGGVSSVLAETGAVATDYKLIHKCEKQPIICISQICLLKSVGTFPIDTTKTRLQIQGQVIDSAHAKIKYRGMLHAFTRIFSEEGVAALYAG